MRAKLVRIGNSKGLRIPQSLLELYSIKEGGTLELEARREGILMRPLREENTKLGWEAAYREMMEEAAERSEWEDWDTVAGDAFED
jgi:antitoxin MazE